MNITEISTLAGNLSPLVLALIAIVAFYRGWVVPQSVIKSIVADTVELVHKRSQADNDKIVGDIAARIIASTNTLLEEHEKRILREFDRERTGSRKGGGHL